MGYILTALIKPEPLCEYAQPVNSTLFFGTGASLQVGFKLIILNLT